MYINKEEYQIYYDDELIENVVDIDVLEYPQLEPVNLERCRDILTVWHLDPDGRLFRIRDSAFAFKFQKRI